MRRSFDKAGQLTVQLRVVGCRIPFFVENVSIAALDLWEIASSLSLFINKKGLTHKMNRVLVESEVITLKGFLFE